jgi:CRP/FNR family cyclic AMP-dependent transcriptional regulator
VIAMLDKSSEFRECLETRLSEWGLPTRLAEELVNRLCLVTYQKGAVIFLRGSPADFVFCTLSGFVKLYIPHKDGRRTMVALAKPGDLLGFVDSLNPENNRTQVLEAEALTKCSLGLVSRDYLIKLMHGLDLPSVTTLLENVNTMWSRMFEWYITFLGLSFRERLELVLDNLRDRVGVNDRRGVLLLPGLTHEDLAEMIGSSRPMVSKLISDMAEDGTLIRSEKQRYVLCSKRWSAQSQIPCANEQRTIPMFRTSGIRSVPANNSQRDGAISTSPVLTVRECRTPRQTPNQGTK